MTIHGHLRKFTLKNDHESDESNELFVLFVPFVFGKKMVWISLSRQPRNRPSKGLQ